MVAEAKQPNALELGVTPNESDDVCISSVDARVLHQLHLITGKQQDTNHTSDQTNRESMGPPYVYTLNTLVLSVQQRVNDGKIDTLMNT